MQDRHCPHSWLTCQNPGLGESRQAAVQGGSEEPGNQRWALSPSVPPLHLGMMLVGTCTTIHPQDVLPTTHSKLETWSTPQVLARQEVAPWNAAWPKKPQSALCSVAVQDKPIRTKAEIPRIILLITEALVYALVSRQLLKAIPSH